MTHNLVVNYGLYRKMEVFRPKLVTAAQMTSFHTDDYINFLSRITPGKNFYKAYSVRFGFIGSLIQIQTTWTNTPDNCNALMSAKIALFLMDCLSSVSSIRLVQSVPTPPSIVFCDLFVYRNALCRRCGST